MPTRAGQLLLGYARRILGLAREAQQALDQFQGRMSGELVIGGSTIPGEYVLPAVLGGFKAKYPEIKTLADESRVIRFEERRWSKEIDLGERTDHKTGKTYRKVKLVKTHPLVRDLADHRRFVVRPEARCNLRPRGSSPAQRIPDSRRSRCLRALPESQEAS